MAGRWDCGCCAAGRIANPAQVGNLPHKARVTYLRYTHRSVKGSNMKTLTFLAAAMALAAQQPAPQSAKRPARPAANEIPESAGDDVRGYNDTPQTPGQKWKVHDMARPRAQKVAPGLNAAPPSDAIVLFAGKDLSQWMQMGPDGKPQEPKWKV